MGRRIGATTKAIAADRDSRIKYLDEDFVTASVNAKREFLLNNDHSLNGPLEDFIPEDRQIPNEGAWIQVKYAPHTEILVELYSVWFALPVYKEAEWMGVMANPDSRTTYKAKIQTPDGELHVYPHEYNMVSIDYLAELINNVGKNDVDKNNHVNLHWLDPRNDAFETDKLFYLLSRGLQKFQAYKYLMGEVKSPHVCYLTMHPEYQKIYAGTGVHTLQARSAMLTHIKRCEKLKRSNKGSLYTTET